MNIEGPEDATAEETAAVAAAVASHVSDMQARAAAASKDEDDSWDGERWTFAGRLDNTGRSGERVPRGAPRDPWTASGRTDRF